MFPYRLSPDLLASYRRTILLSASSKPSHVAEAVASGLGFRSHAAALASSRSDAPSPVRPDVEAFVARLVSLDPAIDRLQAQVSFLQAAHLNLYTGSATQREGVRLVRDETERVHDGIRMAANELANVCGSIAFQAAARLRPCARLTKGPLVDEWVRGSGQENGRSRTLGFTVEADLLVYDPNAIAFWGRDAIETFIRRELESRIDEEVARDANNSRIVPRTLARLGMSRVGASDPLVLIEELGHPDRCSDDLQIVLLMRHVSRLIEAETSHDKKTIARKAADLSDLKFGRLSRQATVRILDEACSYVDIEREAESIIGCTVHKFVMAIQPPNETMELKTIPLPRARNGLER